MIEIAKISILYPPPISWSKIYLGAEVDLASEHLVDIVLYKMKNEIKFSLVRRAKESTFITRPIKKSLLTLQGKNRAGRHFLEV